VALLAAAVLGLPAAASAQTSTIPESGAGVSTTPPVPLSDGSAKTTSTSELPNTGTDPRMLFLAGLALTLLGFGLRLRTADADEY
jgi:LPXTG-motif cell wall-anchored protein